MQRIAATIAPSKYVSDAHMNFAIDGVTLDEMLDEWYPNRGFLGLIPTTLNWLLSDIEQSVVWDRFLNRSKPSVVVPILCCPDDLDFTCTLVMVDTRIAGNTVQWRAFGFDATDFDRLPQDVGANVTWLPTKNHLIFDREEYDSVAREFNTWAQTQAAE
jgi:hypothetical protein